MSYLGDYAEDYADLNFKFTTRRFSTGAPFALSGGTISVYKSNDVAQSTAGVTLTADFDGVTGLNNVKIDLSADAFYATGADYQVVITAGTVDSVSVVGEVVASFSIENRYMRGTNSAATAASLTTVEGKIDTIDGIVDAILVDTGTTLDGKIDTIDGIVDTILVDTNELQTDWVNGGRLDLLIDAILADTNELQTDWVNGGRLDLLIDAILADTNELQTDWVNGGRLDLLIDAIKVVTDAQGAAGAGLTAVPWNAAWDAEVESEVADALAATDSLAAASISAAAANKIADHVLRRNSANVEASSDGDTLAFKSPYGGVAMNTHVKTPSGTNILIKKADGTTTLATVSLTTDAAADPITGTGSA